jgi:hypothetical protein
MDEDEGTEQPGGTQPTARYRGAIFTRFATHNIAVSRLPQWTLVPVVQLLTSFTVCLVTGVQIQVLSLQGALYAVWQLHLCKHEAEVLERSVGFVCCTGLLLGFKRGSMTILGHKREGMTASVV